jgi:hypothetical protein
VPLLDAFSDRVDPHILSKLRETQAELAQPRPDLDETLRHERLDIEEGILDLAEAPETPTAGVFGIGIWNVFEDATPVFFVVGYPDVPQLFHREANDSRNASALIGFRLGFVPVGFGAVELPPTQPHVAASPGDPIICQGQTGRLGIGIWTRSGSRGTTTAGHVASSVRADVVTASYEQIGAVEATDQPGAHQPGTDSADLAVIPIDAEDRDNYSIRGLARGVEREDIMSLVAPGLQGFIRGVSESWAFERDTGSWGDVLVTDHAVTRALLV